MSVYLDASVLVAIFVEESHSRRAMSFLQRCPDPILVSDFASAEFASAIARRVRMKDLTRDSAVAIFATFDAWRLRVPRLLETTSADVTEAADFLRGLVGTLRTPDAINIALTLRSGATLATFDGRLQQDAGALGVEVALL